MQAITFNTQQPDEEHPLAFLLASLLVSYPDDSFVSCIQKVLENPTVAPTFERVARDNWVVLKDYLDDICRDPESVRELQSVYIDVFERSRPTTSLYETEYGLGRSIAKGNELLDIATFYKAFGFEIGDAESGQEMVDHLGVELEFYALMGMKLEALKQDADQEGVSIVDDGRRQFLKNHLGTFSGSILKRPGVLGSSFYFQTLSCIHTLIEDECKRLGVEQQDRPWEDDLMLEEEEITCGSGCLSGNAKAPQL